MNDQVTPATRTELLKMLDAAHERMCEILAENTILRKKLEDGLSCCCAGCTKHNQDLKKEDR